MTLTFNFTLLNVLQSYFTHWWKANHSDIKESKELFISSLLLSDAAIVTWYNFQTVATALSSLNMPWTLVMIVVLTIVNREDSQTLSSHGQVSKCCSCLACKACFANSECLMITLTLTSCFLSHSTIKPDTKSLNLIFTLNQTQTQTSTKNFIRRYFCSFSFSKQLQENCKKEKCSTFIRSSITLFTL